MIVNIEFWSEETLENVISTLNFKFDKTIFLYVDEIIDIKPVEDYFEKMDLVKSTEFIHLKKDDINQIMDTIKRIVEKEHKKNNKVFFEIKGGNEVEFVSMGQLTNEINASFYYYDINEQRVVELTKNQECSIIDDVEKRNHRMNLENFIKSRGAIIVDRMQKQSKKIDLDSQSEIIDKLIRVYKKHNDIWNPFTTFFSRNFRNIESLSVDMYTSEVIKELKKVGNSFSTQLKLRAVLDSLAKEGLIEDLDYLNKKYKFKIKNEFISDCLSDPGTLLEIETYLEEYKNADDCKIGVYLDWDGMIHTDAKDVLNEIDVLKIKNNIPTFISCKNGKLKDTLTPLYELDVVARRFGGKYAKKKLVVTQQMSKIQKERADALGIEIVEK